MIFGESQGGEIWRGGGEMGRGGMGKWGGEGKWGSGGEMRRWWKEGEVVELGGGEWKGCRNCSRVERWGVKRLIKGEWRHYKVDGVKVGKLTTGNVRVVELVRWNKK